MFLGVLIFSLAGVMGWTQRYIPSPYWFTLERGKFFFRNGDYGDALMSFEDARRERRGMYTRMEQDLITVLSIPEVRRFGDSLDRIETYISERYHVEAAAALEELYYRVPKAHLENSATRALGELGRLKEYPEAEYWIGETYRVEGELGVALGQYQKAYEQRMFLENPGFDVEILYKIVDILKVRQEYAEMERQAVEILAEDSLWFQDSGVLTRNAMARVLENEGINRFLTLYRYNNAVVERAHRLLGFYYYASGRYGRAAEHLEFAFLIQNTILLEEIIRNQYDFTFTTMNALIQEVMRRSVLAGYIEDVEYYKTIYYLGAALYGDGKLVPARLFWTFLSGRPEAGEWNGRAQSQLKSPFVEKVQEMP
jgi:tetratricopeptide (TPR) repeat protein